MTPSARAVDRAVRLFRAVLRLAPARFRAAYGADMTALFRQRAARAAAGGRWTFLWCAARGCLDMIATAILTRAARRSDAPKGDRMLTLFARDLRFAARSLRRQPTLTATIVLTLGVAIGATTAIVSLVDATLVRPLPYPAAGRLVAIVQQDERFGLLPFGPPFLKDLRERLTQVEAIASFTPTWQVTVTGAGEPAVVPAAFVSDGVFDLLGARPLAGRLLTAEDERAARPVMVVSSRAWRRFFGDGAALDGQRLHVNDHPVEIVGIVGDDLRMPLTRSINVDSPQSADVWLPMALNPMASARTIPVGNMVGRLTRDATFDTARHEVRQLAPQLAAVYREVARDARFTAMPLATLVAEPVRRPMLALLLAVLVLLVAACANVANLMLARAVAQTGEVAVRAAIGASRARLLQHALAESLVLAGGGTAVGVLLAWLALAIVPALALGDLPPSASIAMNARALAVAVAAGALAAIIVSVVPAAQSARVELGAAMREGGRALADARSGRLRGVFVFAEVALALVLLVAAGLLARSFWRLSQVDPGFRAERVLANSIAMPASRYPTPDSRRAFVGRVMGGLAALPGVQRVAAVNRLPLGGGNVIVSVEIEGQPLPAGGVTMDRRVVTEGYFETLGIRTAEGRTFTTDDRADSADRVAVVNETVARRFWPAGGALGRRVRLMLRGGPGPWLRVVGVVGDVRHHALGEPAQPEVYVAYAQSPVESMVFVVSSGGAPRDLAASVRRVVGEIDPQLPVQQTSPSDLVDASIAEPRLRAVLFNGFAATALLLAALGIYGSVSHAVARRTREIGLRVALGATRADVLSLVLRSGLRVVSLGIAAGLIAAMLVTRALRGLLFGVPALDPLTFAAVTALLAVVALMAALIPARRALRLDPSAALRLE